MTYPAATDGRPIRIGVTNAVLSNTGDAAIYASILDTVTREFPGRVAVTVFDSNARVTSRLYPDWTILQQLSVSPPREPARLRRLLQAVRSRVVRLLTSSERARGFFQRVFGWTAMGRALSSMSSLDLMISSGGTYLVDHYNFQARVDEMSLVASLRVPSILWTQSMGPFRLSRAQRQISAISGVVDAAFMRDDLSESSWRSATTVDVPTEVIPDSVFALEASASPSAQRTRALISVREWSRGVDSGSFDRDAYENSMRAAAVALEAAGKNVVALSTCQGVPSYAYDDSAVAKQIFMHSDVQVDRAFHTPDQLLGEISTAGIIVTTRMHLAILGIISRVPVIAIAYEFKTVELFNSLGLGEWAVRIEEVTPDWIAERVQALASNPAQAILSEGQLSQLRDAARRPAATVRHLLGRA